jgi:hypothetical protein
MFKLVPIIALPLLLLNACSTTNTCNTPACGSSAGASAPGPAAGKQIRLAPSGLMRPVKVTAIGYGATPPAENYSTGQRRLLAMRASKLDAYRALTEEVYGVRITSNSTVSSLISQNDSFRAYVDSYLRGAKVLTVTPLADGNYETVLELDLSDQFYDTMNVPSVGANTQNMPRIASNTQNMPRIASNTQSLGDCGIKGAMAPGCAYGAGFYYAE